jgi:pimeloyl-ACP methyl ester carboxylesterase
VRGDTSNPIGGATSNSFTTQSSTTFDRSSYWARVRDACGATIDSNSARVTTTDKRPLVFVPGIAGSTLVEDGNRELWFGIPCLYDGLTLDPTKQQANIFASDVIRTIHVDPLPFQLKDVYQTLLDRLQSDGGYRSGSNQTLFLVPYDWRKTNATAAGALRDEINFVESLFPGMDVDILAHSMGGIVAQRYVIDNINNHHVNKIITVGTPWLGAPKALNVLETGQFLPLDLCFPSIKDLSHWFPGMHELIPSDSYFNLAPLSAFSEFDWDFDKNGVANETYDYAHLVRMLNSRYPGSTPGATNSIFHSKLGQDDGTLAPANISYYHIYGQQTNDGTIGHLTAKTGIACGNGGCVQTKYLEPAMTAGDGTVPSVSATRIGRGHNLNEPRHQLFPITPPSASQDSKVEHLGLCSYPPVIARVLSILSGQNLTSASQMSLADQVVDEPSRPAYYVQVIGNPLITITDGVSSATISSTSLGLDVPGVNAYIMGDNAFMVVLATDLTYSISFHTGSEPLTINLTQGTADYTTQAIRYNDLVLPANVNATIRFSPQGVESLKYDRDGDGTFETTVTPTVSVSGSASQDTNPPIVVVVASPQGNSSLVTITSSDSGSGVKATYYSIDGTNFQLYANPVSVDLYQGSVVYAFADDNVANRSGVVTYYPSVTPNQLDNSRFFVTQHYRDFLNRDPDPSGLGYWTGQITQCGPDASCIRNKRIDVSNAFFYELEYQQTAAYAFRLYRAAYGNNQPFPNPDASNPAVSTSLQAEARKIPGHHALTPDRAGLIGSANLAQDQLALANQFVSRPEFLNQYPASLTLGQFVDAVIAGIKNDDGVDLGSQRSALLALGSRGAVLYRISDDNMQTNPINNRAFIDAEYNRSFVASQYFGYLRRDADIGGFLFWLGQMSSVPLRDVPKQHAMVCSFTTSAEYQFRFGAIATHSNAECQ